MNAEQFLQKRRTDWEQLTRLLDAAEKKQQRLAPEQIQLLGQLYRAVTSDLALAQRDFPRHQITTYLNQLVGRAHAVIYQGEPLSLERFWTFAWRGYPRLFRECWLYFVVSTLLFCVPAVVTAVITYHDPSNAQWILPVQVQGLIPMIEQQELWVDMAVHDRPYISSFIMTNNIRVAFLAFAGGILAGLLTIYVLIFNGLMLGGLTGVTAFHGVGFELWTFVIGHGVVELTVIFIAGAAGLLMGWSLIRPGLLSRRDALALAAGRGVRLLAGCVPLLIIAGLIEGFISPAETLPWLVKWSVGIGSGVLLYAYLLGSGHERKRAET